MVHCALEGKNSWDLLERMIVLPVSECTKPQLNSIATVKIGQVLLWLLFLFNIMGESDLHCDVVKHSQKKLTVEVNCNYTHKKLEYFEYFISIE